MELQNWKKLVLWEPTETHRLLRKMVRDFAQKQLEPVACENDQKEVFPFELFQKLGELGLLGLTVSEEDGGSGLDALAAVLVHEELSKVDPGFCLAYLAHAVLCVNNVARNASSEQKKRWLPPLISGKWLGCMAMSEPDCGTDVLSMKTTATLEEEHYRIEGRKMWITNGAVGADASPAHGVFLYAKTGMKNGRPEISSFFIERGVPGFSVGQKITGKLGMRASMTAELVFDHCIVPKTARVGEAGDALRHMMRNLEIERLTLAAMSLGIAWRSLEIMVRYAQERKAFQKPLSAFGQIQRYISESYAEFQAARTFVYNTARLLSLEKGGQRVPSDGAKLFAAQVGKRVADRAIQVLGGYGYVGEYVVERLWRDAKLLEIGGGTLEAHQKNITRDLGKDPSWISR